MVCSGMTSSHFPLKMPVNDIDNLRFGWTGFTTSIHWIVPTVAGGMVGFGIITIFMQCFNYLLDTYLQLYFPLPSF